MDDKKHLDILWSIQSISSNLHTINLCTWTDNTNISYNPRTNNYTLDCNWNILWESIIKVRKHTRVLSWCNTTDSKCIYYI